MEKASSFGKVIMPKETKKAKTKTFININKKAYLQFTYCVIGFLCGGGSILMGLNPMALGYLSVFLLGKYEFNSILICTVIGFFLSYNANNTPRYILAAILMFGANFIMDGMVKTEKRRLLIGTGCVLLGGGIIAVIGGMSAFLTLKTVLESGMTYVFAVILIKGKDVIDSGLKRTILTEEESISLVVLLSCVLLGTGNFAFYGIQLKGVIAYVAIFIMAYRGGVAIGGVTGCLVGILLMLGGSATPDMVCILALGGIAGGALKSLGRLPFLGVSFFAVTVSMFYINKEQFTPQFMYTLAVASLIFTVMPKKVFGFVNTAWGNDKSKKEAEYFLRMKEITVERLKGFGETFTELSDIFDEKKPKEIQSEVMTITEKVRDKVCGGCSLTEYCWKRDLYSTYQSVLAYLSVCSKKGRITLADAKEGFVTRCINPENFIYWLNNVYKDEKTSAYWQGRMTENRGLICQQLVATGELIKGLTGEIENITVFNESFEEMIQAELEKKRYIGCCVGVVCDFDNKYQVSVSNLDRHQSGVVEAVCGVVTEVLGQKFKMERWETNGRKNQDILHMVEKPRYNITASVAAVAKDGEEVSGDSHGYRELKKGLFVMALADGMGYGKKAMKESKTAIELMERFLEAGFEKTFAVKMINSIMFLRREEERFSTLDICSVDLYTGEGEFIKTGATAAYIVREGRAKAVRSTSLPVGILENIDIDSVNFKLKDGDVVIMLTDGASDVIERLGGEGWIENSLEEIRSKNPDVISEYILMKVRAKENGVANDDMTVMSAVFWSGVL